MRFEKVVEELHVELVVLDDQHLLRHRLVDRAVLYTRFERHVAWPSNLPLRRAAARACCWRSRQPDAHVLGRRTLTIRNRDPRSLGKAIFPRIKSPEFVPPPGNSFGRPAARSEEHTSELQSPYVISYAVFC